MTPTAMCNLALDAVPAGNIVNLTENSLAAKTCSKHYAQVLGELLEMAPWRFARKFEALAELPANDREAMWLYAYAMPSDMAFPIRVTGTVRGASVPYEFTGVFIYTNTPEAVAEYVTTADVASSHSSLFRAAMVARLAARICLPITKDLKRATTLAQIAKNAEEIAQAANHNQQNQNFDYFDGRVPSILRERMGLQLQHQLGGPDAVYPDFDPVQTFEDGLD